MMIAENVKLTKDQVRSVAQSEGVNPADIEEVVWINGPHCPVLLIRHRGMGTIRAYAKSDVSAFRAGCQVIVDFAVNGVAGGFLPEC
jgi:hypothetical protein